MKYLYISIALLISVILLLLEGILNIINPPYTDTEIQASLVDTWEVSALVTDFFLILLLAFLVLSLFLFQKSVNGIHRVFNMVNPIFTALAIVVQVTSQVMLTNRVTELTGQQFAGMWGLF